VVDRKFQIADCKSAPQNFAPTEPLKLIENLSINSNQSLFLTQLRQAKCRSIL